MLFNLLIVIGFVVMVSVLLWKHSKQNVCTGRPFDTVDSETWYATCGTEAPHREHSATVPIRIT